jgi:hypothetical protein
LSTTTTTVTTTVTTSVLSIEKTLIEDITRREG